MDRMDIYRDIVIRTGGDINIAVAGQANAGKATFSRRFFERLVLPNVDEETSTAILSDINNESDSAGDKSAILQSLSAKKVHLAEDVDASVTINGDKCNIAVLVLTDGSIEGLERSDLMTDKEVIAHYKASNTPMVVVVNSAEPDGESALAMQSEMMERYHVSAVTMNADKMSDRDVERVLLSMLYAFPIRCIECAMPSYMEGLGMDNDIVASMVQAVCDSVGAISNMSDVDTIKCKDCAYIYDMSVDNVDLATGVVTMCIKVDDGLFYEVISSETGTEIADDLELISYIKRLKVAEEMQDRLGTALEEAERLGYGVVSPRPDDIAIGEPTLSKKGSKYSVDMAITAPSYHIIKVDIARNLQPITGTEVQCGEMMAYIEKEAKDKNIGDVTIFSKQISSMVSDEISTRQDEVTPEVREKLAKTLSRIVNEGRGGVLCVLI